MNVLLKISGVLLIQLLVVSILIRALSELGMDRFDIGYLSGTIILLIGQLLFKRYIKD